MYDATSIPHEKEENSTYHSYRYLCDENHGDTLGLPFMFLSTVLDDFAWGLLISIMD